MNDSRQVMDEAMRLGRPARVPVMCQLAIGHTLLQTGADPVDFLLDTTTYADALLQVRELYRFDGVLLHKPGREAALREWVQSVDREADPPVVRLRDGSCIECPADDDPQYRPGPDGLRRPEILDVDPEAPLAWAPESYRLWCRHKGTADWRSEAEIAADWYGAIDQVRAAIGTTHHVHGEVRSPLDHLMAIVGIEDSMLAMLTEPEHTHAVLATLTDWSVAWAVAQVHRGCDAIKLSSPYAGAGFISRAMYAEWVVPYERRIAAAVRAAGKPIYTHTCGAIGDRLDLMMETGTRGIETLDPPPLGTVDLAEAKRLLRDKLFIKGNIDPVGVMLRPPAIARPAIERTLAVGSDGGQFILSTACSVPPRAPRETVQLLAAAVHGEG